MPWLAGCATQNLSPATAEDIPDGANRIIVERQTLTDVLTPDAPALALFVDARQYFIDTGFGIDRADEDNLVMTTTSNEVDGTLMRISANVEPEPAGSQLVAAAEWYDESSETWRDASWTSGNSRVAFGQALALLQGISHSDITVATR